MDGPQCRSFTGQGWRPYGAYVDPTNAIPGPGHYELHRVGNKLHAYAWFQHRIRSCVPPGMTAILSVTVAGVTALKSALVFAGVSGRPELRIDWTTTPPRAAILVRNSTTQAGEGWVTPVGRDFWRLSLRLTNTRSDPIHVMPTFYVTRGVENAGLDLGLFAGDAHFEVADEGWPKLTPPTGTSGPEKTMDRPGEAA